MSFKILYTKALFLLTQILLNYIMEIENKAILYVSYLYTNSEQQSNKN